MRSIITRPKKGLQNRNTVTKTEGGAAVTALKMTSATVDAAAINVVALDLKVIIKGEGGESATATDVGSRRRLNGRRAIHLYRQITWS